MEQKIKKCAQNSRKKPCKANELGVCSHLILQLLKNALFYLIFCYI